MQARNPRADAIAPFWNRLPEIALYPAQPAALATVVVLALCHLVDALPLGLVGLLFDFLIWGALYKYAFECLRATADGRLEPPEVAVSVDDGLGWAQIWLQVVFFALNVLGFYLLGPFGGVLVSIALALALPGAIMSLAIDQNLPHALNPANWLAIMTRFGAPYFAIAALYFVFGFGSRYAQALVVSVLPAFIAAPLVHAIGNYAVIATFHLMGYLIWQYHEDIGYEPRSASMPLRGGGAGEDQRFLDEAAALARDGKQETACDVLRTQLRGRGGGEAMHAHYRRLLAQLGRREEQLRHGREWITVLLGQDNERKAVDVARECLELDGAFEPAEIEESTRLARKALDLGATQVALKLVSAAHRKNPKHRDVPQNSLLAAKLLAERMGKDDSARKLLDQVLQNFPHDPLAGDLRAYRAFLDKLGKPASNS